MESFVTQWESEYILYVQNRSDIVVSDIQSYSYFEIRLRLTKYTSSLTLAYLIYRFRFMHLNFAKIMFFFLILGNAMTFIFNNILKLH